MLKNSRGNRDQRREPSALINDRIRAPKMQVITHDGENLGVVDRESALRIARDAELDLVLLAESGSEGVPVTKIMNYGKMQYEKKKKQAEAKKHQKVIQVKEIKFRPKIGEHDYQTKINRAIQFLKEGKRVKVTLAFRGRENITKQERGTELFLRIDNSFAEHDIAENLIKEQESRMGQFWSRVYYLK